MIPNGNMRRYKRRTLDRRPRYFVPVLILMFLVALMAVGFLLWLVGRG